MKVLLLILMLIPGFQVLLAQDKPHERTFEASLCGELFKPPSGYTGDQYYYRDWAYGDIRLGSGEVVTDKLLKYNGFLDELIWFDKERSRQVKLDKDFIRGFTLYLPGKEARFRKMKVAGMLSADSLEVFAEVLAEGRAGLFVYRKVAVRGSSAQNLDGTNYIFSDLEPVPRYILVLPDHSSIIFTRIRKKNILALLPEAYRMQVTDLLRENHLRLRNEKQLADITGLIR